ncbi:MAG TPA: CPBP family intramembrane glutamic endopeptidase, partial [Steroidobacteraceae bacterium]|nr:CPBP family intramembrane glutamic endopeptidase [Steroidobacteraceae bacterium]
VLILLYDEAGSLSWSNVRQHLLLQTPRSPATAEPRRRLWWWLIPVVILTAFYQLQVMGMVQKLWIAIFPFLREQSAFGFGNLLGTPQAKAQLVGNWAVLALFVISALFNTVLGEELLFRGLLLPRMAGVFKKWDWAANGLLFGLYHLHQPWGMLGSAIQGIFLFALPSRYFRSTWFGIAAHSGQSVYFTILILGLVLGLA